MDRSEIKIYLLSTLLNKENTVISLSGEWGTGKTHLWNDIKSEYEHQSKCDRKSAYVSLFGMSSVNQVKSKLVGSIYIQTVTRRRLYRLMKFVFKTTYELVATRYKSLSAFNDFNILWLAPWYLGNRLIVIDDIERLNEKLSINEIMGFINEYSEQHNTRFLLILNDNKINNKHVWKTLHEKVIDIDIKYYITTEEAFEIAVSAIEIYCKEILRKSIIICGITNIRIVRRIIITAKSILFLRDVSHNTAIRMIPSIVLFSAIKYSPSDDLQTKHLSLEVLKMGNLFTSNNPTNSQGKMTENDLQISKWRSIKANLGIYGSYNFEIELIEFLENGVTKNLKNVIGEYDNDTKLAEHNKLASEFLERSIWDLKITDKELIEEAKQLLSIAGSLTSIMISQLAAALDKLKGGDEIAISLVDAWITADREKGDRSETKSLYWRNTELNLHQRIIAYLNNSKTIAESGIDLFHACMHVINDKAWDNTYATIMNSATDDDFIKIIDTKVGDELKYFLIGMIDIIRNKDAYINHFKSAIHNFEQACKTLSSEQSNSRLSNLMKELLRSVGIVDEE
ncbi:P-loop NTPase fold protein [Acidithiobacillus thiooxidans]|uniref:P-loop NTPase fold protein n=1 Tax=Acidithiobacillus thiooxidans TaxID=930 RepID=UPI0009DAB8FA|nr:P-loop NTPase fold protein [Acidithiobacillus thiooxidans]